MLDAASTAPLCLPPSVRHGNPVPPKRPLGSVLWEALVCGRARCERWRACDDRLCVELHPTVRAGLSDVERDALDLTVRAVPYKVAAAELGLSLWSARTVTLRALSQLSVPGRVHALWLGVALRTELPNVRLSAMMGHPWGAMDTGELPVVTAQVEFLPELCMTEAEHDVALGLALGLSNATIAQRRGRSPRTVANQVRALGVRLGASGRLETVRALVGR